MKLSIAAALLALSMFSAMAQYAVNPRNTYERVVAVVPYVQTGNTKRPLFAPTELRVDGIIAFSCQSSDDNLLAVCEFVSRDKKALLPILSDSRVAGRVFEKGKARKDDIERELKRHKRDFDINRFGVSVQ